MKRQDGFILSKSIDFHRFYSVFWILKICALRGRRAAVKLKPSFLHQNRLFFFSLTDQQVAEPRPGGVGGDLYLDCFEYKLLADFIRLLHALRPGGLGG